MIRIQASHKQPAVYRQPWSEKLPNFQARIRRFCSGIINKSVQYFRRPESAWLISATVIFFVVAFLWLPFGLKSTGTYEEWYMLTLVRSRTWIIRSGRVMAPFPWWVGGMMTPDSFVGVQLLTILFFWAKAFTLYLILRLLRVIDHAHALFIGILFMLYPADTGLLLLRSYGHHSGVFFYLLSVLFLVLSSRYNSRKYLLLMVITHFMSSFTSEATSILALFTPLLILLVPECTKKRKTTLFILWYLVLFSSYLNYGYFLFDTNGYQTMRLERGLSGSITSFLMDVVLWNIKSIGYSFILSWWHAFGNLQASWKYLPYGIAITLTVVGGIWWFTRFKDDTHTILLSKKKYLYGLLSGIAIYFMGFFPFSVTDLRDDTFRVFIYSSLGSAFFGGIIIYLISRNPRKSNIVVHLMSCAIFVFLAAMNALNQHANYYVASLKQQHDIVSIMEQAPYLKPNTVIVMIEEDVSERVFPNEHIATKALQWAYSKQELMARVCYRNLDNCQFVYNGLDYHSRISTYTDMNKIYPYEDLLVFQRMGDDSIYLLDDISSFYSSTSTYNPYDRIASYLPFPKLPQEAFNASVSPNPMRLSPEYWNGVDLTLNDRQVCDISEDLHCSLHLQGDASTPASFHQEIKAGGKAGQIVMLSFRIKTEQISGDVSWPQVAITFTNTDGTITHYYQVLDNLARDWQNIKWKVQAAKSFQAILVNLESGSGSWSVWIDSLQLNIDNIPLDVSNPSFEK